MVSFDLLKCYENLGNAIIMDAFYQLVDAIKTSQKPNLSDAKKAEVTAAVRGWRKFAESSLYDACCRLDPEVLEDAARQKAAEEKTQKGKAQRLYKRKPTQA